MDIGKKVRRLEQRDDGLWHLVDPKDQAELGNQVKSFMEWYRESDQVKFHGPKSTMCYS
jgi:hypothetical protein